MSNYSLFHSCAQKKNKQKKKTKKQRSISYHKSELPLPSLFIWLFIQFCLSWYAFSFFYIICLKMSNFCSLIKRNVNAGNLIVKINKIFMTC